MADELDEFNEFDRRMDAADQAARAEHNAAVGADCTPGQVAYEAYGDTRGFGPDDRRPAAGVSRVAVVILVEPADQDPADPTGLTHIACNNLGSALEGAGFELAGAPGRHEIAPVPEVGNAAAADREERAADTGPWVQHLEPPTPRDPLSPRYPFTWARWPGAQWTRITRAECTSESTVLTLPDGADDLVLTPPPRPLLLTSCPDRPADDWPPAPRLHPDARLVRNQVGNLAVVVDDRMVGWLDLTDGRYEPGDNPDDDAADHLHVPATERRDDGARS